MESLSDVSYPNWFCVEMESAPRSSFLRVCRQFQRAFMRAGAPEKMALFASTEAMGDAHKLYFSPDSKRHVEQLIHDHNGKPCRQPSEDDTLTLLFGIPGAKAQLLTTSTSERTLATKTV